MPVAISGSPSIAASAPEPPAPAVGLGSFSTAKQGSKAIDQLTLRAPLPHGASLEIVIEGKGHALSSTPLGGGVVRVDTRGVLEQGDRLLLRTVFADGSKSAQGFLRLPGPAAPKKPNDGSVSLGTLERDPDMIRRFRHVLGADDLKRLTTIVNTAHRSPETRTDVHVRPGNAPWEVYTTSRRG